MKEIDINLVQEIYFQFSQFRLGWSLTVDKYLFLPLNFHGAEIRFLEDWTFLIFPFIEISFP